MSFFVVQFFHFLLLVIKGNEDDFTFNSALYEPKSGGPTSVESMSMLNVPTKFQSFDSAPELHHWNIHPSVYASEMQNFFKLVDMRVSLLLSPYFLQKIDEGISNALIEFMCPFNQVAKGKLLFWKSYKVEDRSVAILPELKGLLPVCVRAEFLSFSPSVGSSVYCDITSLDKDQGVATVLKIATVRFSPKSILEPFMKYEFGSWTFDTPTEGAVTLEKRDVICVVVVKVGTEDLEGYLMDLEVEVRKELIVLKQDGKRYSLQRKDGEEPKNKKRKKSEK